MVGTEEHETNRDTTTTMIRKQDQNKLRIVLVIIGRLCRTGSRETNRSACGEEEVYYLHLPRYAAYRKKYEGGGGCVASLHIVTR